MRTINAASLAKLATTKGTEPLIIVEVDWSESGGTFPYADRDIGTEVKGKILELGEIDAVIDVLNSNKSEQLSITLDDTDGSIKNILDTNDVHQRDVRVYQWFEGLDLTDRFLLFTGKVTSPITWSEADRTVSFTILSQLEDKEFGFSAEEGQFPFIPKDIVGKPWPVIFGKCLDVPALQINKAVSGSTLCGVGILSGGDLHKSFSIGGGDCQLGMSLARIQAQISFCNLMAGAWNQPGGDTGERQKYIDQANSLRSQMAQAVQNKADQISCANQQRNQTIEDAEENGLGCNPIKILGGEDFPQGVPLTLNINGGLFTGTFDDDEFTISSRSHPENEEISQTRFNIGGSGLCANPTPPEYYKFEGRVPPGRGNVLVTNAGATTGAGGGTVHPGGTEPSDRSLIRVEGFIICNDQQSSRPNTQQVAQHFWAEAGTRAVIASDEPITYIVSITPGEVLAVKAFKELNGVRRLVNVPDELYTVETQTYGSITAVQVVTNKPLSSIVDQGWEDDLYVTFESTIGPDTVEIIEWIIDNYTDLSADASSFAEVQTDLTPFPSNFPVLDRRNTIDLLRDIAFQARCALWISNGVVYLKYLPKEPDADSTISVSDIHSQSVEVGLTRTEDLVTKMVVTWHLSWAAEDPEKIILRHNVKKYGTKEQEFDWFIYNQPDIVLKAATFWLIRKANTWKKIRFRTPLTKLALESFDTVSLDLGSQGYVASGAVKAMVEQADYDSDTNTLQFECLTPVKTGTMVEYQFFWPSALTVTDTFPTPEEIAAGYAGGDGIGADATGELPIGFTDGVESGGTVFVGGPNVVFPSNADYGDRTPTDVGFTAQEIIDTTVFAGLDTSQNPNPDLTLNYIDPLPPLQISDVTSSPIIIDIRDTVIVDSDNPGEEAHLDTIIREISNGELIIDTDAKFGDGSQTDTFDFKYDGEGGQFGAGTAFLKDD